MANDQLKHALKSQYHASLAMLHQSIEKCPPELWSGDSYENPFWRIAYHTLYFVHLYIQPDMYSFTPWEHHQTGIQDMDDWPAPADILELTELPHRPPQTGKPYTKADILTYWGICDAMIDEAVNRIDLTRSESGFSWYKISRIEFQFVTLRHIQHHTGQLTDRIRTVSKEGIEWVGAHGRKQGG